MTTLHVTGDRTPQYTSKHSNTRSKPVQCASMSQHCQQVNWSQAVEHSQPIDRQRQCCLCLSGRLQLCLQHASLPHTPGVLPSRVVSCVALPCLARLQGGFQYYLYNNLFVKWCAHITARVGHRGSAPIKTFIDQAIQ